jgi:predicted Ser/Thr protein kinase
MNFKRTVLVLTLGVVGLGAMAATADAQPLQPAKREVLARVHAQKQEIRAEQRAGKISPMKAHRLLAADRHIAREVRNSGHLTRVQVQRLNHQENRIHRHIQS